jgi:hypothetical protein
MNADSTLRTSHDTYKFILPSRNLGEVYQKLSFEFLCAALIGSKIFSLIQLK